MGVLPDMAGLGSGITQEGNIAIGESSLARFFSTDHLLMSDQQNQTVWHNSSETDSVFRLMSEAPQSSGALLGGELGGRIRWETIAGGLPIFFQGGAYVSTRISGGEQSRTFGTLTQESAQLAAILEVSGESAADYSNGHLSSQYDASWVEIPISIGLRSPDIRPHSFVYGSLGLSLMMGGHTISIDADESYTNVLASHIDTDTLTLTNHSPGAISEQIAFTARGVGFNYGLGVQAGVAQRTALFCETNRSEMSRIATGSGLSASGQQLLTALTDPERAESEDTWFTTIAQSVSLHGASIRIGLRYYFH